MSSKNAVKCTKVCKNCVWVSLFKTRFTGEKVQHAATEVERRLSITDQTFPLKRLFIPWSVSSHHFACIIFFYVWPTLIAMLYTVRGLWLATGYELLYRLPNGWRCGRLWSGRFLWLQHHHPSHPTAYSSSSFLFSWLNVTVFGSSSLTLAHSDIRF